MRALIVLGCLILTPLQAANIYGWVERVELTGIDLTIKAKLDTGAATSSLDATEIEPFVKNGKDWVAFTVTDPRKKQSIRVEKKVERVVRIVRHNGRHQRRFVVKMGVCLGTDQRTIEVSLIDRSEFIYPMLLGRSALREIAVVDPDVTFTARPACKSEDERDA